MSSYAVVGSSQGGIPSPQGAGLSSAVQTHPRPAAPKAIQVGIYRDGENNLDVAEGITIPQALSTDRLDPSIALTVEDTTQLYGAGMHTYTYNVDRGVASQFKSAEPRDMSGRAEMANFVAKTLDDAEQSGAKQTWLFLIDHGAGDAGGLFTQEPDGSLQHMSIDTLAGAIADGKAMHARRHPEDADRKIDGVVMHECFEGTVTVAETLSSVGVRFLAASSETTIAPGVPAELLHDIAANVDNPQKMARDVVNRVMDTAYLQTDNADDSLRYHPAANFMVLDLQSSKIMALKRQQIELNRKIIADANRVPGFGKAVLSDVNAVQGMERDQPNVLTPWRADRPAMEVYLMLSRDQRLPHDVRKSALALAQRISDIILFHRESSNTKGFDADYRDAIGPTVHFPTRQIDIDPDAPAICETAAAQSYINLQNAVISALVLKTGAGHAAAAA